MGSILSSEAAIRLGCFLAVFCAIAAWEVFAPRRRRAVSRWHRWPSNLGLVLFNTLLLRMAVPITAVGVALVVGERGMGLFNQLAMPHWAVLLVSVVALDLVIYFQHRLFHAVPVFWRLHRMHHSDLDFDVTTGIRFHPVEIVLSMGIKLAAVAILGPPVMAVLIFEVLLNATSMFNHGNVRIDRNIDKALRLLIVTPDMHRVHHSIAPAETNSNFGFNLPWWDRLFGTYRAQPSLGHDGVVIGVEQFRSAQELRIDRLLTQPFRRDDA